MGEEYSEGPSQHHPFWNTIQLRSRFPRTVQENVQGRTMQLMGVLASPGLGFLRLLHKLVFRASTKMAAFRARARSILLLFMVVPPLPYVASYKSLLHSLLLLTSLSKCETFHPFLDVCDVFWFLKMRPLYLCSGVNFLSPSISPSLNALFSLVPSPPCLY